MWREPARNLPVVGAPDVLVVGAGSAGIAAAVASARRGAKTWLVERYGFVGGLATFGLVNLLLTLDDGEGTQVVGGLCQELVDRLDARGAARFPPSAEWGREDPEAVERWRRSGLIWGAPPDVVRYSVAFDPEELVTVAYEMLAEAGVHLRLHSWCVAAPTHDGAIDAVVLESKAGRQVVRPRVVIDATGDGDVLVAAGATHERVPVHPYLWFRMGGVDDDAADAAQLGLAFRTTTPGRSLIAWGGPGVVSRKYDLCDPDELTAAELECRTSALAEAGRLRAEAPGFADAWVDDVAKLLGITESRRLVGDFVLEKDHGDLRFPDAVARTGHWTRRGVVYEIPYRCLSTPSVSNLLVAGRCISTSRYVHQATKEIPAAMATGEAAGAGAVHVARGSGDVHDVDVHALRDDLRDAGADVGS
ncbi:MAG TPA: FAD-dependent oxidoreductase [Acidimicrobiia bacterium]|nr:FAD-dependent oxidoreductase [Acidimicrobiia bacterium]